jgi:hypothetical protein
MHTHHKRGYGEQNDEQGHENPHQLRVVQEDYDYQWWNGSLVEKDKEHTDSLLAEGPLALVGVGEFLKVHHHRDYDNEVDQYLVGDDQDEGFLIDVILGARGRIDQIEVGEQY